MEYDLVVVHVDKAIRLLCQLVALRDVAIPDSDMSTAWSWRRWSGFGDDLILAEQGLKILIGALVGEVPHKDLHHLEDEVQAKLWK